MKKRNEKGITMMTLTITIIILLILTFTIITNMVGMIDITNINDLEADIELLKQKVEAFYKEYGEIPAKIEYTNIAHLNNILNNKEKEPGSKFYVIDLQTMKGITLNYGRNYEIVRNMTGTPQDLAAVNNLKDIYIINNITHNIFYVQGIEVDGKNRYTNYEIPENIPN